MQALHSLVNEVRNIGRAVLCVNQRIPLSNYNHAFRVAVNESEADGLIEHVTGFFRPLGINPSFMVSPLTCPKNFADSLLKAGFKPVLEEAIMVYKGDLENSKTNADVSIVATDERMLDVWTDVFLKGFEIPMVLRDAFLDLYRKAIQYSGTKSYLGYFRGKPAGVCGLVSINHVAGIFSVGTNPEYRRNGVASALLRISIRDSLTNGNNLLYLVTTKGSNAQRLYENMGFQVAYTHRRYELQIEEK